MKLNKNIWFGKLFISFIALFCLIILFVGFAYPFNIIGPPRTTFSGQLVPPEGHPPFIHWDMREFPECVVPYTINEDATNDDVNGDGDVNDADITAAFNAIDASFTTWQDVRPSIISFNRTPQTTTARSVRLDGENVLFWLIEYSDDDQFIPFLQGEPNEDAITPGPNGVLDSNPDPDGDDVIVGNVITTGNNGICESAAQGDDIQVIPLEHGLPNSIVIGPGPDGTLDTDPQGDDVIAGNNINSGANGVAESAIHGYIPDAVAITAIFANNSTGRIIESDIWFNDENPDFQWNIGTENPPQYDIQVTATHEIGHFIGLHHTPIAAATMSNVWPNDLSKRSLHQDDERGCNFLYTPDLGDAPDPAAGFNRYPSLVHNPGAGRILNGVQLDAPAEGAEHLFGILDSLGSLYAGGTLQFEWLGMDDGDRIDDSEQECEAKVTDLDNYDDGVEFLWDRFGALCGIRFEVSTNGRGAARYLPPNGQLMYVNAWLDFIPDKIWEDYNELLVHWSGGPGTAPWSDAGINSRRITRWFPPVFWPPDSWFRIRLDWGEDVSKVKNTDGTLSHSRGAAQFGEVEDYPHYGWWDPFHGWHHPYDYYYPDLWPYWVYPSVYLECHTYLWIDVPWWWHCYTFPPPITSFKYGIAVPPIFLEDGWFLESVAFKEYAPNGGGDIIATLMPDENITMELNAEWNMNDGSIWFGYRLDEFVLPESTMVLYYKLAREDACTNNLIGDFHFIAGDELYGWSPELYVDESISINCMGYPYIPGDVDDDGDVDFDDANYLADFLNDIGPPPPYYIPCTDPPFYPAADVTGECVIGVADLVLLTRYLNGEAFELFFCPDYPPLQEPEGYDYVAGDVNMALGIWPPSVIGGDVTYLVGYFIGGGQAACILDGFWASADINGDCIIIGGDVTALVGYFVAGGSLTYCPDYEPNWPPIPEMPPPGWPFCEGLQLNKDLQIIPTEIDK